MIKNEQARVQNWYIGLNWLQQYHVNFELIAGGEID